MYRNPEWILSSLDDFLMQILGMSQAVYGDGWIVGRNAYDENRPNGWPKLATALAHYGFEPSMSGWEQFVEMHIGLPVMNLKELQRRRPLLPRKWCKICGEFDKRIRLGMCDACYKFFLVHRKKRPRHLWDEDATCKNCDIPLSALGKYSSGQKRHKKGYCDPCYNYQLRHQKPRPKHLWGDGPHGWCECGYPAVALVEDIPVCVRHKE